jgi:hypothetical protein
VTLVATGVLATTSTLLLLLALLALAAAAVMAALATMTTGLAVATATFLLLLLVFVFLFGQHVLYYYLTFFTRPKKMVLPDIYIFNFLSTHASSIPISTA